MTKQARLTKAVRIVWASLDSHLNWADPTYHSKHRKKGDRVGGVRFHKKCIREYAFVIQTLSDSM